MLANAIMMSLFSRAASRTSSLGMRFDAQLVLRIDREHDEADLAFAVIGDGLGDGRALAGLEVLGRRVLVLLPDFVRRLPAGHFGMRVHIDRDQILDIHNPSPP